MSRSAEILTAVVVTLCALEAAADNLEDRLDRQLKGAWATVGVELYSNCTGTYSDNVVGAAGVTSKAGRDFAPGELVKIDKIKVKRHRVDLLTTLAVPILASHTEGPFELFEQRECKVQLIFDFPRQVIKSGDTDAVLAAVGAALTTHPSRNAAETSGEWNRRERRSFPPDYDLTLARYNRWQAEQTNAAVSAGLERAADAAADAVADIKRDADYLDGFAAGVDELRHLSISGCPQIIDASFSTHKDSPPSGENKTWKRGFNDGQRLVFNLYLLEELQRCFVPVPAAPLQ